MKPTKVLTYTVFFEKSPEGGYVAFVPALPGCASQGETFEEANKNIKDAVNGYLAVLREDNDEIPIEEKEHIASTVMVSLPA
ncbi:MAG: type II toxin-antitoxin system HicB family antitoxin [Patescibacteria group bacterium]